MLNLLVLHITSRLSKVNFTTTTTTTTTTTITAPVTTNTTKLLLCADNVHFNE
jgi:hypothetical protein